MEPSSPPAPEMPALGAGPPAASNNSNAAPPESADAAACAQARPADPAVAVHAINSFHPEKLKAQSHCCPADGDKPNILFATLVGVTDERVIDPTNDEVMSKLHGKGKEHNVRDIVPKNHLVVLKKECRRRAIVAGLTIPANANWKCPQLVQCLLDNPPSDEDARHCLNAAEAFKAIKKTEQLRSSSSVLAKKLRKLRMFHALFDEEIRDEFFARNDQISRRALDARNSEDLDKDCYELACDLYNDPSCQHCSEAFPELGAPFDVSHALLAPSEGLRADRKEVKDFLVDMRGNLTTLVADYKQSGNGAGNLVQEEGGEEGEEQCTDDCDRINFLQRSKFDNVVGCCWTVVEKLDVFSQVEQTLGPLSASMSRVPSASSTRSSSSGNSRGGNSRGVNSGNSPSETAQAALAYLASAADAGKRKRIDELRGELRAEQSSLMEL